MKKTILDVLDPDLVKYLEKVRPSTGELEIASGYRPTTYNKKSGGKKLSRHQSGDAVDLIYVLNKPKIRKRFERVFANGGIGRGSTITHVDCRDRRARWYY
ncbi:hypothetical protein J4230_00045 [Candidatus Woesearchaeota archaeon]|nr:hypothetical protein [Candidatus Woesearchaeota archaeon]